MWRSLKYFTVSCLLTMGFGLFVNVAFAADYYWTNLYGQGSYPDPLTACRSTHPSVVSARLNANGTAASCLLNETSSLGQVYRYGDSCPAGSTYNVTTGQCEAPEPSACESTLGATVDHQVKVADILADGTQGNFQQPPSSICDNACEYTTPANEECYRFTSGDPAGVFCKYQYRGSGLECASAEVPETASPDPRSPTQFEDSSCTSKTTDANGFVVWECSTSSTFTDPGNITCGAVNGEAKCYSKSPIPESSSTDTDTSFSEKTNPDGSKDTTATTTETTTNCSGVGACSTTTTTTTTTQHTNADGSPGAETTTCEGAGCEDEEEEGESSVSGEDCGVPVACEGDAIQCALLRQQKEQNCRYQEQTDFQAHKQDIDALVAGPEFELVESEIQIPSFVTDVSRWLPASCPAPVQGTLGTVGLGSISLSFQPICDFAEALGPLIVIAAALYAALYVGRSF